MLKTNCKIVKQRIRQHIYDCIIDNLQDMNSYNISINLHERTYTENLQGCIEFFIKCYNSYINRSEYTKKVYNNSNSFNYFVEYMQGLPFNFEYMTYNQRMFLKDILEESEEEANKYNNIEVENKYYYLIYRELRFLIDKVKAGEKI